MPNMNRLASEDNYDQVNEMANTKMQNLTRPDG